MTPELTALTLAALLQMATFIALAIPANIELGSGKTTSPRDKDRMPEPLQDMVSPKIARLFRAFNNHTEWLILFAIAALTIHVTGQSTPFTAACAYTYLAARVAYVPAYYFGLSPWRSYIWFVGFLATAAMLIAALI
ncbi:MAG: MAPEG family protein [Pseudomonadota bacterium]